MRIPNARRDMNLDRVGMTPLIDVIFQLLIFFMCASVGQLRENLLPTELTSGSVGAAADQKIEKPLGEVWIRLRTSPNGVLIHVEGNEFSDWEQASQLLRALAQTAPDIPVYLDNAPDVPFGAVVKAYDLCQAVRFHSIHFAVNATSSHAPRKPESGKE